MGQRTRSLRARRRSSKQRAARRQLRIEILETRRVFSANGVPSNPLDGASPQLQLDQNSRLYDYEMVDRDVFDNSDFAADVRELEQHRGNELDHPSATQYIEYEDRIPDLDTAVIEYGPTADNYGSWYSDYNVVWPTQPSPVIWNKSAITSRDGMDPIGTYTPYSADGSNPDTWGRMADDYKFEQWFFDASTVEDQFPQVQGWHTNDLKTFVPASPDNSTVVTSGTIDFIDTTDPNVPIDYYIPWTLTVTQTSGPGSEWTYSETLEFTAFDITTTWDFDFTPMYYENPDPADGYGIEDGYGDPYGGGLFDTALNSGGGTSPTNPGHIHRTLRQFGDYTFIFTASGDGSTTEDYSLSDDYDDAYTDNYHEDFDPGTLPYETEVHDYTYTGQVLNRVQDDDISVIVGDSDPYGGGPPTTYTESGNLSWTGTFNGDITSTWSLHVTGDEPTSHIDGDELSTMDEDMTGTYSMTYTGNGELEPDFMNGGPDIKVGDRFEDGTKSTNVTIVHIGDFTYSDRLDHMTSNNYDEVTSRIDNWDETLTFSSTDNFDHDIQLLSSEHQLVTANDTGTKDLDYWTEGDRTLNWHDHWETTDFTRDSYFSEFRNDHSEPNGHVAPELDPGEEVTARIDVHYTDLTTREYDDFGYEIDRTGQFDEDGDAWLLRRLDFDGEWDMDGSGGNANFTIDTQDQQDYWDEELHDYYRFIFDDSTTFNADGTSSTIIDEEGEADGDWMISEEGYYNWAAHSVTEDWTVSDTEFYGHAPSDVGGSSLETWLEGAGGTPWLTAPWWGAGTATRSDDWGYWYSDETTVQKNAGGTVTSRVGTVLTDIVDPDSDVDTIDGTAGNSQVGGRDEFVWDTYDYTWDPAGATVITHHHDRLREWDEGYTISAANSTATFNADGSEDYAVNETGVTASATQDHWHSESRWDFDGGYEDLDDTSDWDQTSTWNYTDDYDTQITTSNDVLRSGVLNDWGNSTSTVNDDWYYVSHTSDSSGSYDTTTYDGYADSLGTIDYNYTTTITTSPDPYGGGYETTAEVTGSQTDYHDWDWREDVTHTWQMCEDYGGGPECDGDTESWATFGSDTNTNTYLDPDFFGPRSGRERKFGWLLTLFRFWD